MAPQQRSSRCKSAAVTRHFRAALDPTGRSMPFRRRMDLAVKEATGGYRM